MRALVVGSLLLLSTPARGESDVVLTVGCVPLGVFIKYVTERGYDFAATAVGHDGDKNVVLVRPDTKEWVVAFFPRSAGIACTLNSGTEFRVTPVGRGS